MSAVELQINESGDQKKASAIYNLCAFRDFDIGFPTNSVEFILADEDGTIGYGPSGRNYGRVRETEHTWMIIRARL